MPVINNIVEPIDVVYIDEEKKETTKIAAVLADLSSTGMRIITFLKAPISSKLFIKMNLPFVGQIDAEATSTRIQEKGGVYTMGISFSKISAASAAKIEEMANDFKDCDTRILLKLPEVCVQNCKCHAVCNKVHKNLTLFK